MDHKFIGGKINVINNIFEKPDIKVDIDNLIKVITKLKDDTILEQTWRDTCIAGDKCGPAFITMGFDTTFTSDANAVKLIRDIMIHLRSKSKKGAEFFRYLRITNIPIIQDGIIEIIKYKLEILSANPAPLDPIRKKLIKDIKNGINILEPRQEILDRYKL
jgi:hypothetical protein